MTPLPQDTIEVTGTGQANGVPDQVLLDLRIHAERPSVAEALAGVEHAMSAVLTAAEESGSAAAPARTDGLSVYPQHDPQGQRVIAYNASQQLHLSVAGVDTAGDLITALSAAAGDALGIDSVTLAVSDPSGLLDRARESAFNDARHRAAQFARLAGRSLGDVRAIRDTPIIPEPEPRLFARAAMAESGGMPIVPGEHTLTAAVTVSWDLHRA